MNLAQNGRPTNYRYGYSIGIHLLGVAVEPVSRLVLYHVKVVIVRVIGLE